MNEALRLTVENGISLTDAVQMASTSPARILGLSNKGKMEIGYDADFVLLNEKYEVQWTMIEGQLV